MNKNKKVIGVIIITMFLLALSLNFGLFGTASADHNPCPGWDGYTAFCGFTDGYPNPCEIVADCVPVCPYGCN